MAAQAGRIAQAAQGAKIGRTPLTQVQREERSRRTTIRAREKERRVSKGFEGVVTSRVNADRERSRRQTVAAKGTEARTTLAAAKINRQNIIATQTKAYQQRNLDRNAAAIVRRREYNDLQNRESIKRQLVTQPITSAVQPAARSGFLLLGVFAGLIVLYAVLNNPQGFTGWLGGLGSFIATFTQNGPLFSRNTGSNT